MAASKRPIYRPWRQKFAEVAIIAVSSSRNPACTPPQGTRKPWCLYYNSELSLEFQVFGGSRPKFYGTFCRSRSGERIRVVPVPGNVPRKTPTHLPADTTTTSLARKSGSWKRHPATPHARAHRSHISHVGHPPRSDIAERLFRTPPLY